MVMHSAALPHHLMAAVASTRFVFDCLLLRRPHHICLSTSSDLSNALCILYWNHKTDCPSPVLFTQTVSRPHAIRLYPPAEQRLS